MNITNISELIRSGILLSTLPIPQKRLEDLIDGGYLHSSERKSNESVSVFGSILLLLFDALKRFGYSTKILREIHKNYYSDSISVGKISIKEGVEVYDFPLVVPVLLTLSGQKHYLIVSGEGDVSSENEESMVAFMAFSEGTGESMHGKIFFDIEVFLSQLGIKPEHHSKGTFKKLSKELGEHMLERGVRKKFHYEKKYYNKLSDLGDSISNTARVPNRTIVLKSNDKGAVTSIIVSTRKELQ